MVNIILCIISFSFIIPALTLPQIRNIPFITMVMDLLFWHCNIGFIVFRRKTKMHCFPNLAEDGRIAGTQPSDDEELPRSTTEENEGNGGVEGGTVLSQSTCSRPSLARSVSKRESTLQNRGIEKRKLKRAPTYGSLMARDNHGRKRHDRTTEMLVRLYEGERGLEIPNDEIMLCKKNFYIRFATIFDQVFAVLLPTAFTVYLIMFNGRWKLDWSLSATKEYFGPPNLIFANGTS